MCLVTAPLTVVADIIPCIGPGLSGMVSPPPTHTHSCSPANFFGSEGCEVVRQRVSPSINLKGGKELNVRSLASQPIVVRS
jgi:hypothetical protein